VSEGKTFKNYVQRESRKRKTHYVPYNISKSKLFFRANEFFIQGQQMGDSNNSAANCHVIDKA
jgi:hypothetical protein